MPYIAAGLNGTTSPVDIMSKVLIKNFDNNTVMSKLVNRELSSDLAQFGDTVKLARPGSITVGNYTGADLTFQDVTMTTNTLVLNQVKQATFQLDKVDTTQSALDLYKIFSERMTVATGIDIDTHLLGVGAAGVDPANVEGASTAPVTFSKNDVIDKLRTGKLALMQDNIPTDNLVFVTTPEVASYLVEIMGERETSNGDNALMTGRVGKVLGIEVYETTNLTPTAGVYTHLLFNRDLFIHHVMRIPPEYIKMVDMFEKNFKTGAKALYIYGSKVFHPTAGYAYLATN
jgi:hypothetical protein